MRSSPENSTQELSHDRIVEVSFDAETMLARFEDGQTVALPLTMFPRLMHGSAEERSQWRLIGKGRGIYWLELDEDLSAEGILARRPSMESDRSLHRWLEKRTLQQAQP